MKYHSCDGMGSFGLEANFELGGHPSNGLRLLHQAILVMNKTRWKSWEHGEFGLDWSVAALIYVPVTHKNLLVDASTPAMNYFYYVRRNK